ETFRALEDLRPRQGPHRRSRARNEGRQPLRRDGQTAEQLYRVPAREAAIPKPPGGLLHRGRPRAGLSCARRELGGCGRYLRARRCTPLPRGLRRALARVRDRAGTTAASRIMAAFRPRIERMPRSIDVTVAAVIERDDRFLLVEENACGKIVFNQPAGHLEPDESLLDAVVRETLEETGYRFEPRYLVGIYLWKNEATGASFLRVTFTGIALPPAGTPSLDDGIIAVHWLTRNQLLGMRH